jgi:hypothetical protein
MTPEVTMSPSNVAVATSSPASLSSPDLVRRLAELCGEERNVQVDFLLHLDAFDRRRGWAEAGYGSLWSYCLEVLHLRESSAGRRIAVMKLLRRFPALEAPLRDGRLSLSTADELGPVLTDENLAELVARAAFLSTNDTRRLVASIRPEPAPADGVRRVGAAAPAARDGAAASGAAPLLALVAAAAPAEAPVAALATAAVPVPAPRAAPRVELRPVTGDTYTLRVTLDEEAKASLDQLVSLLSHTAKGDLAAVVKEALRCAVEKHGKRKGAVAPSRSRAASPGVESIDPRGIPMAVRRGVYERDGGRCAWTSADGKRCGSTWKLEFGHLTPVALGGRATVDGIRLECRAHNLHEAVRVFGAARMRPYLGELTPDVGSH